VNGHEVDPPVFVFGGSNFLVGNLPFSPLGYLCLSKSYESFFSFRRISGTRGLT